MCLSVFTCVSSNLVLPSLGLYVLLAFFSLRFSDPVRTIPLSPLSPHLFLPHPSFLFFPTPLICFLTLILPSSLPPFCLSSCPPHFSLFYLLSLSSFPLPTPLTPSLLLFPLPLSPFSPLSSLLSHSLSSSLLTPLSCHPSLLSDSLPSSFFILLSTLLSLSLHSLSSPHPLSFLLPPSPLPTPTR